MKKKTKTYIILLLSFLLLIITSHSNADNLVIAAANSTCSTIKKIGALFEQQHAITINYICKSSGRLAKGINGKSIATDIYISASKKWMDNMLENKIVDQNAVSSLWGNALVIAVAKKSSIKLDSLAELTSDKIKTILIGDPGTAPFGRYAKQALSSSGVWTQIKNKIETKKHITLLADI